MPGAPMGARLVECCTHLSSGRNPAATASLAPSSTRGLRFYRMFERMKKRVGAGKSEQLFVKFVETVETAPTVS